MHNVHTLLSLQQGRNVEYTSTKVIQWNPHFSWPVRIVIDISSSLHLYSIHSLCKCKSLNEKNYKIIPLPRIWYKYHICLLSHVYLVVRKSWYKTFRWCRDQNKRRPFCEPFNGQLLSSFFNEMICDCFSIIWIFNIHFSPLIEMFNLFLSMPTQKKSSLLK